MSGVALAPSAVSPAPRDSLAVLPGVLSDLSGVLTATSTYARRPLIPPGARCPPRRRITRRVLSSAHAPEVVTGTLVEKLWLLPAAIAAETAAGRASEWLRDMQRPLISALMGLAGVFTYSILRADRKRQKLRAAIEAAVTLRPSNQPIPDSPL